MNKETLRLALPNIISNVSVPLLSSVDTALMGHESSLHIGAVGVGAMAFNFIYWNFGFLRMGTTGMTAQAYGHQNQLDIVHTLGRALLVAGALAVVILLLQWPAAELSFFALGVSGEQRLLVEEYFYIRVWAAPATLALYAFMGWFFGMQNAIYPLLLTLLINVTNIALSFLFVEYYGMGVSGVAYGTLLAQYVGLAGAVFLLVYRYGDLLPALWQKGLVQWEQLRRFLVVNADIFLRTLCLTGAFGFFYNRSLANGELILAVNTILLQFLNWMAYGVDGFAYAAESLVGKYKGANLPSQTRKAIRYAFGWGLVLGGVFALAYGIFGRQLVHLFTDQPEVVRATMPYLLWMAVFPLLGTPCYIWDGVFIGLTASKAMRNTMLIALVFFVFSYVGLQGWGNHGLLLALLVFLVVRGGVQWWWYERYLKPV